jgi:hypothetical protein
MPLFCLRISAQFLAQTMNISIFFTFAILTSRNFANKTIVLNNHNQKYRNEWFAYQDFYSQIRLLVLA